MNVEKAIHKRVLQLCQEKNISPADAGYRPVDGEETTVDTIAAICATLGITITDFFSSDLF